MNALIVRALLLSAVTTIASTTASCPCYTPCSGKSEVCHCFGPCGDDGYACKSNGDDYEFLSQSKCSETEWIVQCARKSSCSARTLLDDSNPLAAYIGLQGNALAADSFGDGGGDGAVSAAHSTKWFGGNWFDFWGQNEAEFFVAEERVTRAAGDLGRNAAGYDIVAVPLYILVLCICGAAILGMAMCAGFVWCGLHCLCPLPRASPLQRPRAVEMRRVLESLALGGRRHKKWDPGHGVYRRMSSALHNPSQNEDNLSIASLTAPCDEYLDSEDNQSRLSHHLTAGNVADCGALLGMDPFSRRERCDSDIDRDSNDDRAESAGHVVVEESDRPPDDDEDPEIDHSLRSDDDHRGDE